MVLALMKKPVKLYVVILFVVLGFGMASLNHQYPWSGLLDSWGDLFTRNHWRNPWHLVFFLLQIVPAIALIAYCFICYLVQKHKEKAKTKAEADWYRNLDAAVDVKDFEDSDCLYDWLEPNERQKLLHELQRMPRGSRSLHKALQIVSPELIDDTA